MKEVLDIGCGMDRLIAHKWDSGLITITLTDRDGKTATIGKEEFDTLIELYRIWDKGEKKKEKLKKIFGRYYNGKD